MFDLDKKAENRLTLTLVVLLAAAVTASVIYMNSTHDILGHSYRDVFFYLIESLRMSGVEITGYAYVNYLPPFVPFLTSLLFRMGYVSLTSIFITSGIFFFIGIIGLFKLLRLRFNNFYAFFGAFVYATLEINVIWVGNGTLDIPFVALMIWALYFFIQGMEKNQKYFYLAFPLAVLSFFTKYTGALIVGVMMLYFMSRTNIARNIKKYFKNIFGGIIAGALTSLPFFAYFIFNNIPFGFLNQAEEISSSSSLTATHQGVLVGNDLYYYLNGISGNIAHLHYIGAIVLAVTLTGIVLAIYMFSKTFKDSYSNIKDTQSSIYKWTVPAKLMYVLLVISFIMVIVSFFTASLFSFVYSEILLFSGMYILAYSLTKIIINNEGVDNIWLSTYPFLAINIAMAGLFLCYLVFFSSHLTKADRYFTSMAPGFVFVVTLSVELLINRIKGYEFGKFNLKYLIPIVIMLLLCFVFINHVTNIDNDSLALAEKSTADWLGDKQGIILSDRGPIYTWMLQKEIPYAVVGYNETLNQVLLENNATYYTTIEDANLTDYEVVKEFGDVDVYRLK